MSLWPFTGAAFTVAQSRGASVDDADLVEICNRTLRALLGAPAAGGALSQAQLRKLVLGSCSSGHELSSCSRRCVQACDGLPVEF